MHKPIVFSIMVLTLALSFSSTASAKGGPPAPQASVPPPPGWKPCPRCQNNNDRKEATAKFKVEGHAFDAHDLSGVWGYDGVADAFRNPPSLTPFGKQKYEAT